MTATINIRQMSEMCSQSKGGMTIQQHRVYFDAIKLVLDFMVYHKIGFTWSFSATNVKVKSLFPRQYKNW